MATNSLSNSIGQAISIELQEWEQVGPVQDQRLKGISLRGDARAQRLAEGLRGQVDIREGYEGLEITSSSFVGRVDVGPLRVAIGPKLAAMPLARLLRYAYGLRDVTTIDETNSPTVRHGLQDLLIALLAAEVNELLRRGLPRRYVSLDENLASPRGNILVEQLVRQGGVRQARLPCRHFERQVNWQLNQVLRAGLETAALMTTDPELRRRMQKLSAMFGEVEPLARFQVSDIDIAERNATRLTAATKPALTIIRLLVDMLGVTFDSATQARTPGFLFDMNMFFQRLLSRFLHDHLMSARIEDEVAIRELFAYAPGAERRQRRAPRPRPDYALFDGRQLKAFLDAKYRDVWERSLPAEWLYQLSIYALASPSAISVLLYASTSADARDERLDVRHPLLASTRKLASVILRPVPLQRMADLLDPDHASQLTGERRALAHQLVNLRSRSSFQIPGKKSGGLGFSAS